MYLYPSAPSARSRRAATVRSPGELAAQLWRRKDSRKDKSAVREHLGAAVADAQRVDSATAGHVNTRASRHAMGSGPSPDLGSVVIRKTV
jgi:hypothetical protein